MCLRGCCNRLRHVRDTLLRALLLFGALLPLAATAQMRWQEGRQYSLIQPAAPTSAPRGRIEVTEVFSYGCIYCYRARNEIQKLKESLPTDTVMNYVHASFNPAEDWPMLQRAFYTARSLGIAEATHDQLFMSIWETGEFPLLDPQSGGMRKPLPGIEDAARFYHKYGFVNEPGFVNLANSPVIDAQMKEADRLVALYGVEGTPAVIVNGRYRINAAQLSSWDEMRQIVLWLVGLERQRLGLPQPAAAPAGR